MNKILEYNGHTAKYGYYSECACYIGECINDPSIRFKSKDLENIEEEFIKAVKEKESILERNSFINKVNGTFKK